MKVTFIYPDLIADAAYTGHFYFGIASLSAMLKQKGHHTSLIHITRQVTERRLLSMVEAHDADLLAFSATSHMFPQVKKWACLLKRRFDTPIVVGGIHATIAPGEVVSKDCIDYVCVGEGEHFICELCDALENETGISHLQNLCWKEGDGNIRKNALRPLIEDLDLLPFADRAIFRYEKLEQERRNTASFLASRGCPYSCAYCCTPVKRNLYSEQGTYYRIRSPENIVREIKHVVGEYGFIREVSFCDEMFPTRREWLEEFVELYRREIGLPFRCQLRPEVITKEMAGLFAEAGCRQFNIGVESGSERIRKEILNRKIEDRHLLAASKACRENHIRLFTFNMLGIPGENAMDMLSTIKLNAKMRTTYPNAFVFYPYPGTALYKRCDREGLLTDQRYNTFTQSSPLRYNYFRLARTTFFRNFFVILMMIYNFCYGRGRISSRILERSCDTFLLSRFLCVVLYPIMNGIAELSRKTRILNLFLDRIKESIRDMNDPVSRTEPTITDHRIKGIKK